MNSYNSTPPGWYPANNNSNDIRWWDGTQWTIPAHDYQNMNASLIQPPNLQANNQQLHKTPDEQKTLGLVKALTVAQIVAPLIIVFLFGWFIIPLLSNPTNPTPIFGFFGLPYGGLTPVLNSFFIAVPTQIAIIITGFIKIRTNPHLKTQPAFILFKATSIIGLILGALFLLLAVGGAVLYALAEASGAVYTPSS